MRRGRPQAAFFEAVRALDDAHDVGFLHDQEVLAIDLDLGAGPLAEQDAVAGLDVERHELAALVAGAGADGDDFAFLRLLLGGVGDDDAAGRLLFGFDAADDDAVVQGTKLHGYLPLFGPPRRGGAENELLALSVRECQ